jgi:sterol 3beta-glucosyltransferase
MVAVVHHGGVGTTGAGLTAGVPNVVVPHFADQYFWGRQVDRLGAGPPPIPRRQLTAGKLALAIDAAVNHQPMRQEAAALARRIAADGGVARAIEIFEAFVAGYRS